jgi:hypothetical protein
VAGKLNGKVTSKHRHQSADRGRPYRFATISLLSPSQADLTSGAGHEERDDDVRGGNLTCVAVRRKLNSWLQIKEAVGTSE